MSVSWSFSCEAHYWRASFLVSESDASCARGVREYSSIFVVERVLARAVVLVSVSLLAISDTLSRGVEFGRLERKEEESVTRHCGIGESDVVM
jgi:hypothetical protein